MNFRRPSKAVEDAIAGGWTALGLLRVGGLYLIEGGSRIVLDGKIVATSACPAASRARTPRSQRPVPPL